MRQSQTYKHICTHTYIHMYTYIPIRIHTHTHTHTHTPSRTTRDAQSAAEAVVRSSRSAWEENAKVRKNRRGCGGRGGRSEGSTCMASLCVGERQREEGGGGRGGRKKGGGRERDYLALSRARTLSPSLPPPSLLPPFLSRTRSSRSAFLSGRSFCASMASCELYLKIHE